MPITKLLYSFIENGPLTGSLFGTASYALDSVYSASLASRSNILESASSSFSTRVTNLVTDSGSFSSRAAALEIASGSFSTRITNLVSDSGSFSTRITNLVTDSSSFSTRTATLETASGSFSTRVTNLVSDSSSFSARLSSYTGSIFGTASYATKAETLVSGININAGLITASAISVTTLNVVTITSSIEYASGSNIFGTKSTDTQKFTGSVSITGSLTVNGTVTATSSYSSLAATASYFAGLSTGVANYVAKFTGANTLATSSIFESGSSVGIGTTSPGAPLTVASSTTLAAGEPSIILQGVSNTERLHIRSALGASSGQPVMLLAGARGTIASPTAVQDGDSFGFYQLGGYNGTTYRRGAAMYGKAEGAHSDTSSGTAILFQTTESGSLTLTDRMTINGAGNVGIGMTPVYKLDVTAGNGNGLRVTDSVNGVQNLLYGYNSVGYVGTATNHALAFNTNGSERLRIDTSGNVGIGTTSPAAKLHVVAPSVTTPSLTWNTTAGQILRNENLELAIGRDANAPYRLWMQVRGSDNTANDLVINPLGGNVGIGTTSPSFKTEIQQGSSGATSALRTTPQLVLKGFGGSSTYHSGIGFSMYEHTNGYWGSGILEVDDTNSYGAALAFYTSTGAASASPSERVRISSAGAIIVSSTIGTTSSRPAVGTSRIAGEIAGAYTSLGSDGGFLRLSAGGGTGVGTKSYIDLSGYSTDAALETQIQLGTAGVPRMTINVSGNVGINTTSPSAKLHVFNSTAVSAQAVTSGTNLIIESATSSYLEFRNTSDNGTNQGILFVDNNLGGYVGFTNAATDQMFIGGYAAVNLQVGASNSFGGKTTIAAITSAGAAITGAITATGNITAYFSDDRLKTKLGKIENALEKICSLDGFYYEANDLAQSLGYKAVREVGISAQSVQSVLPEIVAPAPIDSKYLTIHYERTVPLIIEAIKELRNEIAALKK